MIKGFRPGYEDGGSASIVLGAQLVEELTQPAQCLELSWWMSSPSMLKALVHLQHGTWGQTGAEGSEVQGHPSLHKEFEANLGYMRPWIKLIIIINISRVVKISVLKQSSGLGFPSSLDSFACTFGLQGRFACVHL